LDQTITVSVVLLALALFPGLLFMVAMTILYIRRPDTKEIERLTERSRLLEKRVKTLEADNIANYAETRRLVRIIYDLLEGVMSLRAQLKGVEIDPVWEPTERVKRWLMDHNGIGLPFVETNWSRLVKLQGVMEEAFNDSELRDIAFHFNISYDNLTGSTLRDRIRELILHLERRNRIDELIRLCKQLRPNVEWPEGQ
jgi:hypothetical protein